MATNAPVQPDWDPRLKKLQTPLAGVNGGPDLPITVIKRGMLVQDTANGLGWSNYNTAVKFHFQYNPSTVQASVSVQQTGAALTYLYANQSSVANYAGPVNGSVSWTVMFDRTYELWGSYNTDGTPKNANSSQMQQFGNDATVVGCWADIMQMMYLTGMFENGANSGASLGGTDSSGNPVTSSQQFNSSTGFMQMVPAYLYFGPPGFSISYYGYVSQWDYTVTHWSQYMIPMRCAIDINFAMLPPPTSTTNASFNPSTLTPSGGPSASKIKQLSSLPGI